MHFTVDANMHPYCLDRIIKFYWELSLTIDTEKKIEYADSPPPHNSPDRKAYEPITTLDTLIYLYTASKDLKDDLLSASVLAKLRHNLHHGYFELDEFLGSIRLVYGMDMLNENNRLVQKMFLSAATIHSLSLSAGEKRTLFHDLQRQIQRFGQEYSLAMSWRMHVWKA